MRDPDEIDDLVARLRKIYEERKRPSAICDLISICQEAADTLDDLRRWKDTIEDALVVSWCYTEETKNDPEKALQELRKMEVDIALDPAVSSAARALIDQGKAEAESIYLARLNSICKSFGKVLNELKERQK